MIFRKAIYFIVLLGFFLSLNITAYATNVGVFIGVGQFKMSPTDEFNIPSINNDINQLKIALVNEGFLKEENIYILRNDKAGRSDVIKIFDEIAKKYRRNDNLFFYFSGHGVVAKNENASNEVFLVPYDFVFPETGVLEGLDGNSSGLVSTIQLIELLSRVPCRNVILVLDSCHSGIGKNISSGKLKTDHAKSLPHDKYYGKNFSYDSTFAEDLSKKLSVVQRENNRKISDKNIIIMSSSGSGELSYYQPESSISYFTKWLVSAMDYSLGVDSSKNNYKLTLGKVFSEAQKGTFSEVKKNIGVTQTPELYFYGSNAEKFFNSLLLSDRGAMIVKSTPGGADIYIDDEYRGQTPNAFVLRPGKHTVVLNKQELMGIKEEVEIKTNKQITFEKILNAAGLCGYIPSRLEKERITEIIKLRVCSNFKDMKNCDREKVKIPFFCRGIIDDSDKATIVAAGSYFNRYLKDARSFVFVFSSEGNDFQVNMEVFIRNSSFRLMSFFETWATPKNMFNKEYVLEGFYLKDLGSDGKPEFLLVDKMKTNSSKTRFTEEHIDTQRRLFVYKIRKPLFRKKVLEKLYESEVERTRQNKNQYIDTVYSLNNIKKIGNPSTYKASFTKTCAKKKCADSTVKILLGSDEQDKKVQHFNPIIRGNVWISYGVVIVSVILGIIILSLITISLPEHIVFNGLSGCGCFSIIGIIIIYIVYCIIKLMLLTPGV